MDSSSGKLILIRFAICSGLRAGGQARSFRCGLLFPVKRSGGGPVMTVPSSRRICSGSRSSTYARNCSLATSFATYLMLEIKRWHAASVVEPTLLDRLRHPDGLGRLDGQQPLRVLAPERGHDRPLAFRMARRPQPRPHRSVCCLLSTNHLRPPRRGCRDDQSNPPCRGAVMAWIVLENCLENTSKDHAVSAFPPPTICATTAGCSTTRDSTAPRR